MEHACWRVQEKRRVRKALEMKKSAEDRLAREQEKSVNGVIICLCHFVHSGQSFYLLLLLLYY